MSKNDKDKAVYRKGIEDVLFKEKANELAKTALPDILPYVLDAEKYFVRFFYGEKNAFRYASLICARRSKKELQKKKKPPRERRSLQGIF